MDSNERLLAPRGAGGTAAWGGATAAASADSGHGQPQQHRWDPIGATSPTENARARRLSVAEAHRAPVAHVTAERSLVIATVPRSGSWLLAEALEATGVCGHPREYFRADYQKIYAASWGLTVNHYSEYIDGVLANGTSEDGTFGVKIHWAQMVHLLERLRVADSGSAADADLVARFFPNPRYVFLTRDDKSYQAVSLYKAIHQDVWWSFEGETRPHGAARPLPKDPDFAKIGELEALLGDDERSWERYFGRASVEPVRVRYEDLCDDYEGTVEAVLAALGIPGERHGVRPARLRKQADAVSDDWVNRYRTWSARG